MGRRKDGSAKDASEQLEIGRSPPWSRGGRSEVRRSALAGFAGLAICGSMSKPATRPRRRHSRATHVALLSTGIERGTAHGTSSLRKEPLWYRKGCWVGRNASTALREESAYYKPPHVGVCSAAEGAREQEGTASTRASQASQGAAKCGLGWPQGEELGATISVSIALMPGRRRQRICPAGVASARCGHRLKRASSAHLASMRAS